MFSQLCRRQSKQQRLQQRLQSAYRIQQRVQSSNELEASIVLCTLLSLQTQCTPVIRHNRSSVLKLRQGLTSPPATWVEHCPLPPARGLVS